ncbi:MAG: nucleotide exchange factor GrpE [Dehalococcoidia bacterium]|nr:nucleotide exchange factor GrpE [Dehalococcoidia bacterium]
MDEKDISSEPRFQSGGVEGEGDVVVEDVESLKKALTEEKARAEDYLANWQRAQADFINFKRRTEQERNEMARFANATLLVNLLPVLDDLERALENVSAKLAGFTWVDGIALIYRKLQTTLERHGLTEIKALGETFDPNLHEAVLYGDGDEGRVIEELQKGYRLHDRVLRPTLVKVGKGKED